MKTTKKKVIVCGSSQGVYGGIEIFMVALAEYLHGHSEYEVELLFKLTRGSTVQDSLAQLTQNLPFTVTITNRGIRQLMPHFRRADLIHTQNVPPDVFLAAKLMGKPIVATVHNWRRPKLTLHTLLWRITHALMEARTYNSNFVRASWTRQPESIRSQVIPTVSRLQRKEMPWEGRKGFVFVGRWIANKGLDDLVTAYAQAGLDSPDTPLTLLGGGPLRSEIESLINQYDLHAVRILGQVTDEEKFRAIASARWLVAPPRTQEDLGLTPIEARALRIPVIASRDGGLPESAGEHALFFEPGDIAALSRSLQIAARMPEEEYRQRASEGFKSLDSFLRPLSDYTEIYAEVL